MLSIPASDSGSCSAMHDFRMPLADPGRGNYDVAYDNCDDSPDRYKPVCCILDDAYC